MLAYKFLRRSIVVPELMPQDLKLDQLRRNEAVSAARHLAAVVGKAHARQMTPECGGSRLWSCIETAQRTSMLPAGCGEAWWNSSQITKPHTLNIAGSMR